MKDAGFIIGSYVLTLGTVGLFAWRTLTLGRRYARRLPDDQKYWT